MRKQSEGLTKEYDRLLEEHAKLQVSMLSLLCCNRAPPPRAGAEQASHSLSLRANLSPSRGLGSKLAAFSPSPPFFLCCR